jgi:nicotinamide-nucleotide amidase
MERQGRLAVILPGVPHEMTEIMVDAVVPALASRVQDSAIVHRTLRTTGISESLLAQKLGDLNPLLEGAALAFLPSPRGVRLRITVHGKNAAEANARAGEVEERIRRSIGTWVYGTEQQELEDVLGSLLKERGQSIAVAESCTGGLIADRITNVSGSSAYFERGIVAYSDRSKTELLGVPRELIDRHGAVSREVAEAMASGVRRIAGVDIGLSTTGIAGPAGGSEEKPVGLVWIGHANADGVSSVRFQFGDRRLRVKERASQAALELVRRTILKIP